MSSYRRLSLWERFRQWRKRDALRAKRFREKHKTLTNAFEIFFYVMVNLALSFSVLLLYALFTQFEVIMKLGLLALTFAVWFGIGGLLSALYFDYRKFIQKRHVWE